MKKILMSFILSLGEALDWLAADPAIKAVMPSEMYNFKEYQRERPTHSSGL